MPAPALLVCPLSFRMPPRSAAQVKKPAYLHEGRVDPETFSEVKDGRAWEEPKKGVRRMTLESRGMTPEASSLSAAANFTTVGTNVSAHAVKQSQRAAAEREKRRKDDVDTAQKLGLTPEAAFAIRARKEMRTAVFNIRVALQGRVQSALDAAAAVLRGILEDEQFLLCTLEIGDKRIEAAHGHLKTLDEMAAKYSPGMDRDNARCWVTALEEVDMNMQKLMRGERVAAGDAAKEAGKADVRRLRVQAVTPKAGAAYSGSVASTWRYFQRSDARSSALKKCPPDFMFLDGTVSPAAPSVTAAVTAASSGLDGVVGNLRSRPDGTRPARASATAGHRARSAVSRASRKARDIGLLDATVAKAAINSNRSASRAALLRARSASLQASDASLLSSQRPQREPIEELPRNAAESSAALNSHGDGEAWPHTQSPSRGHPYDPAHNAAETVLQSQSRGASTSRSRSSSGASKKGKVNPIGKTLNFSREYQSVMADRDNLLREANRIGRDNSRANLVDAETAVLARNRKLAAEMRAERDEAQYSLSRQPHRMRMCRYNEYIDRDQTHANSMKNGTSGKFGGAAVNFSREYSDGGKATAEKKKAADLAVSEAKERRGSHSPGHRMRARRGAATASPSGTPIGF